MGGRQGWLFAFNPEGDFSAARQPDYYYRHLRCPRSGQHDEEAESDHDTAMESHTPDDHILFNRRGGSCCVAFKSN